MNKNLRRSSHGRRPAREWAVLLDEWRRSGLDIDLFAARNGLRPRTLRWWRWRLRQDVDRQSTDEAGLRLVEVRVEDADEATARPPAWELITLSGHVLRVHRDIDGQVLDRVLGRLVVERR